jgi:hypothetical protein
LYKGDTNILSIEARKLWRILNALKQKKEQFTAIFNQEKVEKFQK